MRTSSSRHAARLVVAMLAGCVLMVVAGISFAPQALAQTIDGLEVESSTTFEPDPDRELINVRATYIMKNLLADETLGGRVTSYSYTKWIVALPSNVANFAATSDGVALDTTLEPDPNSDSIVFGTIALPFNLSYQQTVELDVSYTIPGGEPRNGGATARVNESFLSFSVWAQGNPGMTDITVLVPDGFSMDLDGELDELLEQTRDGETVLEALDIANPQLFFGQVFGRNDDGLLTRTAELSDSAAVIRARPDDPEWADFVVKAIEDDVPVIEELIGLPWPAGDIEVIESVNPYLLGYGGWFNATSGVIEIGEGLDRELILHELSHAWFDEEFIAERWIIEGLAQEFASRAIEATGDERPDPDQPDLDDPQRVPLDKWAGPWTLDEEVAAEYEPYHYNASWWVLRQITEDVGLAAFSDVLIALTEDALPYPGEGPIEQTTQSTRWTHLFDLLETEGASDLDELFATYVLGPSDIAKLEPRRVTLAVYHELVGESDEWGPPLIVRRHLSTWRFDAADDLITDAREIIALRDTTDLLASELTVTIEHRAETVFETATTQSDLDRARVIEETLFAALESLKADRTELINAAAALKTNVAFEPLAFDAAVTDLAAQHEAIASVAQLRNEVTERAADLNLNSPAWPVTSGPTDFTAAAALANARLATLEAIADATATVEAPRGFSARVGLWGNDAPGTLASARSAFEADDLDDALTQTGQAEIMIAQASARGQNRLTWAGVLVITLVAMTSVFVWSRRRTSAREEAA